MFSRHLLIPSDGLLWQTGINVFTMIFYLKTRHQLLPIAKFLQWHLCRACLGASLFLSWSWQCPNLAALEQLAGLCRDLCLWAPGLGALLSSHCLIVIACNITALWEDSKSTNSFPCSLQFARISRSFVMLLTLFIVAIKTTVVAVLIFFLKPIDYFQLWS